jgi:hypothetical protein
MRHLLFCTLVLVAACKKEEKAPPSEVKPEATKPTEAPAPTEAKPAVVAPAASGVKLAAGEAPLGCVGWSEKTKTAACVVGQVGSQGDEVQLSFLGAAPAQKLAGTLDAAMVTAANTALADYVAFDKPATKLEQNKPASDVGGVALKHTMKEKDKGGENQPPTNTHTVIATCNGKDVEVYKSEEEGFNIEASYRPVSAGTLVEIATKIGREGEYASGFEAKLVDASCAVK